MRSEIIVVGLAMVGLVVTELARGDDNLGDDPVSAAVAKSLPLLQSSAAAYTNERSCFSCHHQSLPAMTVALARRHKFEVDDALARTQSEHTERFFDGRKSSLLDGNGVPGGPFTAGYALVGLADDGWPADETTTALVQYLLKTQTDDGSWHIRTHRPPMEDSHFTATVLSLRGLQLFAAQEQADDVQSRVERARKWLIETSAKTNEDRIFRLLGLHWSGAAKESVRQAADELLAAQRDDGGWAQLDDMTSDAYATGQALYALCQTGCLPVKHQAYQHGVRLLIATQQDDGSWLVKTRSKPIQKYFESGFPHGKHQFISIAGTCWATMALTLAGD